MSNAGKPRATDQRPELFVRYFCEGKSGTEAARLAGYAPKSAHVAASRLLRKDKVRAAIDAFNRAATEAAGITVERTRRQIARLAYADVGELFDEAGALRPVHTLSPDARAQVASIEVDEIFHGTGDERRVIGVTRKVRLRDMGKALDQCIDILGMARATDPGTGGAGLHVTVVPWSRWRSSGSSDGGGS